jgi:hypothetical protein
VTDLHQQPDQECQHAEQVQHEQDHLHDLHGRSLVTPGGTCADRAIALTGQEE